MPTFNYTHPYPLNAISVLGAAGEARPTAYALDAVDTFIENRCFVAGNALRSYFSNLFSESILELEEYRIHNGYVEVFQAALSRSGHVKAFMSEGVWQAQFVDEYLLGDSYDMDAVKREAYEGLQPGEWPWFYRDAINGKEPNATKFHDTMDRRLEIMRRRGFAPFWVFVEDGSDGYPVSEPKNVLEHMNIPYVNTMATVYRDAVQFAVQFLNRQVETIMVAVEEDTGRKHQLVTGTLIQTQTGKAIVVDYSTAKIDKRGNVHATTWETLPNGTLKKFGGRFISKK